MLPTLLIMLLFYQAKCYTSEIDTVTPPTWAAISNMTIKYPAVCFSSSQRALFSLKGDIWTTTLLHSQ